MIQSVDRGIPSPHSQPVIVLYTMEASGTWGSISRQQRYHSSCNKLQSEEEHPGVGTRRPNPEPLPRVPWFQVAFSHLFSSLGVRNCVGVSGNLSWKRKARQAKLSCTHAAVSSRILPGKACDWPVPVGRKFYTVPSSHL